MVITLQECLPILYRLIPQTITVIYTTSHVSSLVVKGGAIGFVLVLVVVLLVGLFLLLRSSLEGLEHHGGIWTGHVGGKP
mmetsp:Transcript_12282/g.12032  ORF Transcript_12282/g.12032 Transcript_12282/m.12032 type:complete len:80 (+) Transcript_12282:218-457(+)